MSKHGDNTLHLIQNQGRGISMKSEVNLVRKQSLTEAADFCIGLNGYVTTQHATFLMWHSLQGEATVQTVLH